MPVIQEKRVYHTTSDDFDVQTDVVKTKGTRRLKPGKTFRFKSAYVPFGGESYQAKGKGSVISPESIRLVFTNPHTDTDQKVEKVYTGEEINDLALKLGTSRTLFSRKFTEKIIRHEDSQSKPSRTNL